MRVRFYTALLGAVTCWGIVDVPRAVACDREPEPPDHLRAVARQHYTTGVEASTEGRWMEAREAFQRAYDIAPFAPVVYNLATAQAHTGKLVQAAENYRRFLRRCESQRNPQLQRLRSDAEQLLASVLPRVGRLILRIANLAEVDAVELDGVRLATAVLDTPIPINPGPHQLRVLRGNEGEVDSRVFQIEEGQQRTIELTLAVYTPPASERGGDGGTRGGGDDTAAIVGVTVGIVLALGAAAAIVGAVALVNQRDGQEVVDGTWPEPVRVPLIAW